MAEKIMMYTEEEIKRMQEQFDKENQAELRFLLKEEHKKGAQENLEANIKALYKSGVSIDLLSKSLNLTKQEIEKILKS